MCIAQDYKKCVQGIVVPACATTTVAADQNRDARAVFLPRSTLTEQPVMISSPKTSLPETIASSTNSQMPPNTAKRGFPGTLETDPTTEDASVGCIATQSQSMTDGNQVVNDGKETLETKPFPPLCIANKPHYYCRAESFHRIEEEEAEEDIMFGATTTTPKRAKRSFPAFCFENTPPCHPSSMASSPPHTPRPRRLTIISANDTATLPEELFLYTLL